MARDRIIMKIALDFAVLVCVAFPLLALMLWAEPYRRGFFVNDLTIRLPYKNQTISEGLLAGLGFALNTATIIVTEIFRNKQGRGIGDKFLCGSLVPGWVWESYISIGIFTFGAAAQQLTCNMSKYVIGRLRPHFYAICQPVYNATAPNNIAGYIQDYECANTNQSELLNSRLSFPSAHASFAMYSAVFFILYVQVKGKWLGSKLLRHAVQFMILIAAWYVGLSRVVDHMHHWGDVAAGFAIGTIYALVVFVYILKPKKYGLPGLRNETARPHAHQRPALAPV